MLTVFFVFGSFFVIPPKPIQANGVSIPTQMNKSFTPTSIPAGSISTLSVNIYNPNFFPLVLSTVPAAWTDTLPAGVTFANPADPTTTCGGTVSMVGQTLSLIGGTVPAKVGDTFGECRVTVKVTSVVAGNHDNVIPANNLVATDPTGTISITNTSPATQTLQVDSLIAPSITKAFTPNTQWVGLTSQLTIAIRNNDLTYSLTEAAVTDNLPADITIANTTVSFTNCGSAQIVGPGGVPLAAGQTSITLRNATIPRNSVCTARVNVISTIPGVYVNTIPANAVQTRQAVTNASAASAPINFQSIGMSKSFSPGNFQAGGTSTMTIVLQNPSASPYTGVGFTDNLPAGLTIASAPNPSQCGGSVSFTANSISLTGGTIPAGTVAIPGTCTITATVTSSIASTFTNTIPAGSLTSIQGATNVTDVTANVSVYSVGTGLTGSKGFNPSTIAVDGVSQLSINIRAPADTNITNFSLTDSLPAGVRVASNPSTSQNVNCVGGTWSPSAGDTLLAYTGGSIPVGQQCTLRVNVTSSAQGTYTNVISPANISNSQNRNLSSNISATLRVSGISVSKSFYPSSVNLNGISTATIVLTNINTSQLDDVAFIDNLQALQTGVVIADNPNVSTTCVDAIISAPAGGSAISMTNGKIPAQVGSVPGICTVNVDVKGVTIGGKINRIPVNAVSGRISGSGITVYNPFQAQAVLTVENIVIEVIKDLQPRTVFGGAASTMTVRLSNPNNTVLSGIRFTDILPVSTDPLNPGRMTVAIPALTSTGTCGGTITIPPDRTSFTFSGGSLNPDGFCELTINVTHNVSGNLTNVIPIGSVTTANGAANTQSASATLTNLPGVSLSKYFTVNPVFAGSGNLTTLSILIENTGNVNLTGLGFTDTFPSGIMVAAPPAVSQCNGTVSTTANSVTLTGGSLLGQTNCTILVNLVAAGAGSYQNCIPAGTLTSNQNATNVIQTCDTLVVEGSISPPSINKAFTPNPVNLASSSALTFTITNSNNNALTGVAFTDTFPAGMTRASVPNVSQCGGAVSSTASSVTLANGSIPANSSCTVTISVRGATGGDYPNTSGNVTSTNGGTGNTASATLQVVAPPTISKVFSPNPITASGVSTLTFTLTNPAENTLPLTGVAFTDVFPTGVLKAVDPATPQCGGTVTSTQNSITLANGSISVGGSCTVNINVSAPNAGVYINTSNNVTSTNGGTGPTATETLTVNGVGLALVKTSLSANYKIVGDLVTYSYQLINTGDVPLYAPFTVNDDHFASPILCLGAAVLPPSEILPCTAQYTVTAVDVNAKSITNVATATAKDESNNDVTSNQSRATVRLAALTLDKSTNTLSYRNAGNLIIYDYTLTNTGGVTLYAPFTVTDDHFATPLSCSSATSVLPGGVISCSRNYSVTQANVNAGSTTNIAVATGQDAAVGGSMVTSNSDSVTVFRVIAPIIAKAFAPNPIPVGGISKLTLTVTNPNPVTLTGVSFIDNLPPNVLLTVAPTSPQCGGTVTYDGTNHRVVLSGGSIIPNGFCTVSVSVTSSVPGDHLNTTGGVQSSNGGIGNSTQATLSVLAPPVIVKSFAPISILEGETSTLTIRITNPAANTQALTGVALQDFFPANLQVSNAGASATSNCGTPAFSPSVGDTSLNFSNGTIAVGGTCVITVPVRTLISGVFPNTTTAVTSTNGGNGVPSNTATLTVNSAADLAVTKDDRNTAVEPGEAITYQMVVTNNGPSAANGAKVFDTIPSTLTNATWTCAPSIGASCTPSGSGNINDTVNMPASGSITYTVIAKVASNATTSVVNSASTIPPSGLIDPNYSNNIQADNDKLNLLEVLKSVVETGYDTFGQILNYNYTVTNTGTSTLTAPFSLTDDLANITCTYPGSLAPAEQFSCTGTYEVSWEDLDNGSITNNASASAVDPDGDPVTSNTATVAIPAYQEPAIGAAKRLVSIEEVSAGTYDVTFEIKVRNFGNVTIHNVRATDEMTSTFPLPTTFTIESIESDDLSVNPAYDGDGDPQLLEAGNTLAAEEEKVLTVVVRVIPTSIGPYNNSADATALHPVVGPVSDNSQNGSDPDPDDDEDPTNNNDPTPVDFGPELFDPPFGVKRINPQGIPILEWTMVWINDTNIVGVNGYVQDPIPGNTSFYNTGIDSGYPVPAGAPAGSTSEGVSCTSSPASITRLCYYEGPTLDTPLGQIIWEGTIGPDFGVTNPNDAVNAVSIVFNVLNDGPGVTRVRNRATIDSDRNGDGDVDDPGETAVAVAARLWDITPLPATGFTPGMVTLLPEQPKALLYADIADLMIEIPSLGIQLPIVGVSQFTGTWDLTWLGNNAGWLEGTAFPSWPGNSAITAHVYDATGKPGPFANLQQLKWGDEVVIEAWGQRYIYEVRETNEWVNPNDTGFLPHEDFPWLTLITCKGYNLQTNSYDWRVLVRAVQVRVE